jgi:hypothetical protein
MDAPRAAQLPLEAHLLHHMISLFALLYLSSEAEGHEIAVASPALSHRSCPKTVSFFSQPDTVNLSDLDNGLVPTLHNVE